MFTRLVVDCQFYLVGLVDLNVVVLGFPAVVPRRLCAGRNSILNFYGHKCFGAAGESRCGSVIDILDCHDSDGKLSTQRLAQVGHVDRVI